MVVDHLPRPFTTKVLMERIMAFTDLSKRTSDEKLDPDGFLAEQLFRVRYHYAVNSAHGMERLAFKVLPYSVIRSLALTFDPTEPFRLGNLKFAPIKRTRVSNLGVGSKVRSSFLSNSNKSWAHGPNTSTCRYDNQRVDQASAFSSSSVLTTQPGIKARSRDTTKRLREIGQEMGELELFKYSLINPDRHVANQRTSNETTTSVGSCQLPARGGSESIQVRRTSGGAAYISDASVTTLRNNAIAATNQVLTDRLSGLIAATLPNARRYNLARNVYELRDLPRSIKSLETTMRDLAQSILALPKGVQRMIYLAQSPKNVPGEYLSYWFGWVSTFDAVKDLIEKPAKIAKEVNYLISRRGLPTTLRRQQKFLGGVLTAPGWSFNPTQFFGTGWAETVDSIETVSTFETEVRLVLNCTFDFPGVGVPELRSQTWERKLGLYPTASDVYKVIPWTWLFDWFSGLGNYVEAIDAVNTDRKTINWGVVSAVSEGKHRTTLKTYYDNQRTWSYRFGNDVIQSQSELSRVNTTTEAVVDWKVHVRKDVAAGFGVRKTLLPSSMTTWQQSIIGALLAQRTNKARFG